MLPIELWAQLAIVADDTRPRSIRLRALTILERTARDHRCDVARELVPLLSSPPDIAAAVHVALLVLDPALRVARVDDPHTGAPTYVAAEPHELEAPGLDALHRLFGPGDELPAFLSAPDKPSPEPYRPPPEVLEVRRLQARFDEYRTHFRAQLEALGLDDDDLDDDVPAPRAPFVSRRDAPLIGTVDEGDAVVVRAGERVLDVGAAHAGAWWADERKGDHRGARRFHLRLDRDAPSGDAVVRRERTLPQREATIEIVLGAHRVAKPITGRGFVVFVEEERGLVVGVTLSWSDWTALRAPSPSSTPQSASQSPENARRRT